MKKITSSVYTFDDIRKDDFLYIDKTEFIWNLACQGKAMYFLSRPRRFGKSLTVSTLKALFQGKKELFKGLAIENKDYDWKPYPVIHLSFADLDASANTPQGLRAYLLSKVNRAAAEFAIELSEVEPGLRLGQLMDTLYKKSQVVVLVDEYDKPILNNIDNSNIKEIRDELKGFFSVLKDRNEQERFLFVTGVSKFCHVSLFSELNNLTDITMNREYAAMFGYTQDEFEKYFADRINLATKQLNMPREQLLPEIKAWYDGYRFEDTSETVYNPVSLAQFFTNNCKFQNYWFSTGTPSFLMEFIKKAKFDFENVLSRPVAAVAFDAFEIDKIDPLSLLLQTGYLTIKSLEKKFNMPWYWLDFPNQEVSVSFNTYLLNAYAQKSKTDITNFCEMLADSMVNGNMERLRKTLEVFFAGIPYDVHHKSESNFQNIFYAIFRLLGYYITAESHTSDGSIDAVAETAQWIYIFEFKLNKDDSALKQIKEKEYFRKHLLSSKRIMLIGVNFNTNTGKLSDWKNEEVEK